MSSYFYTGLYVFIGIFVLLTLLKLARIYRLRQLRKLNNNPAVQSETVVHVIQLRRDIPPPRPLIASQQRQQQAEEMPPTYESAVRAQGHSQPHIYVRRVPTAPPEYFITTPGS